MPQTSVYALFCLKTNEPPRGKTNNVASEQVRHKHSCASKEDGIKPEILDLKKKNCTIRVAKTQALIRFAVTAKLICAFVFTYADCWFSHGAAHLCKSLIIYLFPEDSS